MRRMEIQTVLSAVPLPRLSFSIAEAEVMSGLSRATIYRLIAAGKLQTVQRGRRRLVPKDELERLCRPDSEAAP